MSFEYDFNQLKEAIKFNTVEVLPIEDEQLDKEIARLVEASNKSGQEIRHYIGFEISGKVHIGTGISSALKIKKLVEAGVKCHIFLADYHTWLNQKLDGKIETIRKVATEYFKPMMEMCLKAVGIKEEDLSRVEFLLAKDEYEKVVNEQSFWLFDMKIGKELTLNRVLKSISVMGKEAGEGVKFGTLRYPVMQVADAFFFQAHIVHAGLDQRKCHVLMREVATSLDKNTALSLGDKTNLKPITVHHDLLLGLEKPNGDSEASKMSKSKPDSAIWVHDNYDEILRKLKKAYCPMPQEDQAEQQIEEEQRWNPLLDWSKKMIYPAGKIISVERPEKFGGNVEYANYEELKADYFAGKLHPMDLKTGMAKCLAGWFEPMTKWAEENQDIIFLIETARK